MTQIKAAEYFSTLQKTFTSLETAKKACTDKDQVVLKVQGNDFVFERTAKQRKSLFSCCSSDPTVDVALKLKASLACGRALPLLNAQETVDHLKKFQEQYNEHVKERYVPKVQAKKQLLSAVDWDFEVTKQDKASQCVPVTSKLKDAKEKGNFKAALIDYVNDQMVKLKEQMANASKQELSSLEERRLMIMGWVGEMANYARIAELFATIKQGKNLERLGTFDKKAFENSTPETVLDQRCLHAELLVFEQQLQERFDNVTIQAMNAKLLKPLVKQLQPLLTQVQKSLTQEACADLRKKMQDLQVKQQKIDARLKGVGAASPEDIAKLARACGENFEKFEVECDKLKVAARTGKDERSPVTKTASAG